MTCYYEIEVRNNQNIDELIKKYEGEVKYTTAIKSNSITYMVKVEGEIEEGDLNGYEWKLRYKE